MVRAKNEPHASKPTAIPSHSVDATSMDSLSFPDADAKLFELLRIDIRWRLVHEVDGVGSLAEGDDFADGFFSSEEHHHTVDTKSDAAVRRRAVGQRIEKKAE